MPSASLRCHQDSEILEISLINATSLSNRGLHITIGREGFPSRLAKSTLHKKYASYKPHTDAVTAKMRMKIFLVLQHRQTRSV